jgi:hypothetical protein
VFQFGLLMMLPSSCPTSSHRDSTQLIRHNPSALSRLPYSRTSACGPEAVSLVVR